MKQLGYLKWGIFVNYVYKMFEASDWSRWGYSHRFSESHSAVIFRGPEHMSPLKGDPCKCCENDSMVSCPENPQGCPLLYCSHCQHTLRTTLCYAAFFLWRKLWWLLLMQVIKLPSFISLQVAIYILLVVGNCLSQANSPLLLEFTVEVCYPVSEVISGGWIFLGWVWNLLTNKSNK